MNETFFQNRIPSAEKLLAFGFSQEEGGYAYGTPVCDGAVEILDLRAAAEKRPSVIDGKRFFAGYHMNKKHWVTALLDGSVPSEELYRLIDESYLLAAKK